MMSYQYYNMARIQKNEQTYSQKPRKKKEKSYDIAHGAIGVFVFTRKGLFAPWPEKLEESQ